MGVIFNPEARDPTTAPTFDTTPSELETLPPEIRRVIFSHSGLSCLSLSATCTAFRAEIMEDPKLNIYRLACEALGLGFKTALALPWGKERSNLLAEAALFIAPGNRAMANDAARKTLNVTNREKNSTAKKSPLRPRGEVLAGLAKRFVPLSLDLAKQAFDMAIKAALERENEKNEAVALSLVVDTVGIIDPDNAHAFAKDALKKAREENVSAVYLKPILHVLAAFEPLTVLKAIAACEDAEDRAELLSDALDVIKNEDLLESLPLALSIIDGLKNAAGDDDDSEEGDTAAMIGEIERTLVSRTAPLNLETALGIAEREGADRDALVSAIALAIAPTAEGAALKISATIKKAACRKITEVGIITHIAGKDPVNALSLAEKIDDPVVSNAVASAIVKKHAVTLPSLALECADSVKDPILREKTFYRLLKRWAKSQNEQIDAHLHELKNAMHRSRLGLKLIRHTPSISQKRLMTLLNLVTTPIEKIEAKMLAAKALDGVDPLLSSSYALNALGDIMDIPDRHKAMTLLMKDMIQAFVLLQPDETKNILDNAVNKNYKEGVLCYLISALARQDPKKALDYMNALIFTAELRHEILVDAAKSIAGRGKSGEIEEVKRIIAFAANEPASLQKVKLYLLLAEAFKNIEPLQSN